MTGNLDVVCWYCSTALSPHGLGHEDECLSCGRDTRVCRNCRFYHPSSYNGCSEPQSERILEKERANFCDFFQPGSSTLGQSQEQDRIMRENAKKAAEALFNKG